MVKQVTAFILLALCVCTAFAHVPINHITEVMMHGFTDKSHEAAFKIMNGGDASDLDTIVEDYFLIIRSLHPKKPEKVELDAGNFGLVIVDGTEYDLFLIPHNDGDNTNRQMEIEVLLNDETPAVLIEEKLNQMIQENW